ncbi:MAG: hypothetical protein KKH60_04475, partial [Proteobacteria bacterium]|nr:hypothetical protein [Pseudomonadota bacterium]
MISYLKTNTLSSTSMNQVLIFVGLALISGFGLSFGIHSLLVGHDQTFGTSREVPWGILVS